MRRQYFDYRPRPHFRAFHRRKERFACLVTHRRAGKTVACIHELQRRAIESTKKHPRLVYLSPLLKQSKTVAWDYLRDAMSLLRKAGATVNETELRADYPNGGQSGFTGRIIRTPCAASISTASCSTNMPTWIRGCGRRSFARVSATGRDGRYSSARREAAIPYSRSGSSRGRNPAGSR